MSSIRAVIPSLSRDHKPPHTVIPGRAKREPGSHREAAGMIGGTCDGFQAHRCAMPRNDGVRCLGVVLLPLLLSACQQHMAHAPGTPEYAAAIVSRGYDCGLRVERGRIVAHYRGEERQRFVATNQRLAVHSYNAPKQCAEAEKAALAAALRRSMQR